MRRAAQLHVPLLMLTGPTRLPDLAAILERHPDLDVVIDHMADCPPDRPDLVALLLDLARYPRVYVKISHTWSLSREAYPWRDTHDLVQRVLPGLWRAADHVGHRLAHVPAQDDLRPHPLRGARRDEVHHRRGYALGVGPDGTQAMAF